MRGLKHQCGGVAFSLVLLGTQRRLLRESCPSGWSAGTGLGNGLMGDPKAGGSQETSRQGSGWLSIRVTCCVASNNQI